MVYVSRRRLFSTSVCERMVTNSASNGATWTGWMAVPGFFNSSSSCEPFIHPFLFRFKQCQTVFHVCPKQKWLFWKRKWPRKSETSSFYSCVSKLSFTSLMLVSKGINNVIWSLHHSVFWNLRLKYGKLYFQEKLTLRSTLRWELSSFPPLTCPNVESGMCVE